MKKFDEPRMLSEEEVCEILGRKLEWIEIIDAIAETFIEEAAGRTNSPPKVIMYIEPHNNDYRIMPSYMFKYPDFCGSKIISACPDNMEKYGAPSVNGVYILNDARTQNTVLIFKANTSTAYRTAAATAVAVRELAKKDSKTLGIIGCGLQAYYHIPAVEAVRQIDKVFVHDKSEKSEARLLNHFRPYPWSAKTMVKSTKEEILEKCDIIVTLTPTTEPFIFPKDIPDREMLICAVGGDSEHKLEIAPEVLCYVDHVCDSYEQVMHTGTVLQALKKGYIDKGELISLGDHMVGKMELNDEFKVKLFLSTGVALEDLAMAILIYKHL